MTDMHGCHTLQAYLTAPRVAAHASATASSAYNSLNFNAQWLQPVTRYK
jgi:hypothetical protein